MKKITLIIITLLSISSANAQLTVDTTITPLQWVQNFFAGTGVTISNVTYTGANIASGTFNGSASNIGFTSGVLLTNGSVTNAIGPNNLTGITGANGLSGDPDLDSIWAPNISYDASVLEFDFVPSSNNVKFRYIFGSDEYMEYASSIISDGFGVFISGPGISGPYSNNSTNIALVPGTINPVTINNINLLNSPTYYFDNGNGMGTGTAPDGLTIQYDGFTVPLYASVGVLCGQTYHIKIVIADGADDILDSGVFLEAGSFSSTSPIATFSYTGSPYNCYNSSSNPFPTYSGGGISGIFTASPAGLSFVNDSTGQIDFSNSAPGTYLITNTISASCGFPTAIYTSTITIIPSGSTFSYVGSPYCQTGVNPFPTFSGAGSAGTFTSTPAGLIFVSTSTGEVDLLNSAIGSYTVTNFVLGTGGCPSTSCTSNIQILSPPVASFIYSGSPYCQNGSNPSPTYVGGGIAGYFFSSPAGLSINVYTGVVDLGLSAVGTYMVTNNTNNGACSVTTDSSSITINAPPTVNVNSGTICSGEVFNLVAGGANSYTWSAGATSTGINTATSSPTLSTSYTVIGTTSGCSDSAISNVTVNPVPLTPIVSSQPGNMLASSVGGIGYSYEWYLNGVLQTQDTTQFIPCTIGTWWVVVTNSFGCSATSAWFNSNSCSTGINEVLNDEVIILYPNPVIDKLNIQISNYEQTEIILYDLSSRKFLQQTFTNSTTINIEQLAKGMYLYTVRNRNGIIKNGRVIKE